MLRAATPPCPRSSGGRVPLALSGKKGGGCRSLVPSPPSASSGYLSSCPPPSPLEDLTCPCGVAGAHLWWTPRVSLRLKSQVPLESEQVASHFFFALVGTRSLVSSRVPSLWLPRPPCSDRRPLVELWLASSWRSGGASSGQASPSRRWSLLAHDVVCGRAFPGPCVSVQDLGWEFPRTPRVS